MHVDEFWLISATYIALAKLDLVRDSHISVSCLTTYVFDQYNFDDYSWSRFRGYYFCAYQDPVVR